MLTRKLHFLYLQDTLSRKEEEKKRYKGAKKEKNMEPQGNIINTLTAELNKGVFVPFIHSTSMRLSSIVHRR